jgi:hypothetical protein
MRIKTKIALSVLLASLVTTVTYAENFYVGGSLGGSFPNQSQPSNSFIGEVDGGYMFKNGLGAGLSVMGGKDTYSVQAQGIWQIPHVFSYSKLKPYLSLGLGDVYLNKNSFGGSAGIGLAYQINSNWEVTGNYKLLVAFKSNMPSSNLVSFGFRYNFDQSTDSPDTQTLTPEQIIEAIRLNQLKAEQRQAHLRQESIAHDSGGYDENVAYAPLGGN